MVPRPDSEVEQLREALKHHDDFNAAVITRTQYLAAHLEHATPSWLFPKPAPIAMPKLSEDAALAIIDVQEDFCPPNGALAVQDGRDIMDFIEIILQKSFKLKFATRDSHPPDHISFASQHPGAQPFVSKYTIRNPEATGENIEEQEITLWPDHCVEGTPGCEFAEELDMDKIHQVISKGSDRRVEAYSGFGPPFRNPEVAMSELSSLLSNNGIKRVFVCGLALDYCVMCTAIDAAKAGYETFVIEEATKAVDQSEEGLRDTKRELEENGVTFVTYQDVVQMSLMK